MLVPYIFLLLYGVLGGAVRINGVTIGEFSNRVCKFHF